LSPSFLGSSSFLSSALAAVPDLLCSLIDSSISVFVLANSSVSLFIVLVISKPVIDTKLFANTKTLIEESIKLHNKSGTAAKAEDKKEEEPKKEGDNKTGEAGEQKE
jgi:hypothetical protein